MFEQFHRTLGTKIRLDADQIPRDLIHQEHFRSRAASARGAAQEYLRKYYHLIGTKAVELHHLRRHPERDLIAAGVQYRIHAEKPQFGTTTVAYYQTVFGLPVWEAGLAVHMRRPASKRERFRIVGAQSTRHAKIQVRKPPAKTLTRLKNSMPKRWRGSSASQGKTRADEAKSLRILRRRLMVYRYEKSKRCRPAATPDSKARKKSGARSSDAAVAAGKAAELPKGGITWLPLSISHQFAAIRNTALDRAGGGRNALCSLSARFGRPCLRPGVRGDPVTLAGGPRRAPAIARSIGAATRSLCRGWTLRTLERAR